jgi:hypothetical protein
MLDRLQSKLQLEPWALCAVLANVAGRPATICLKLGSSTPQRLGPFFDADLSLRVP